MQYYIEIKSQYPLQYEPFAPFVTPGDREVLKRFMAGHHLVNWNYTCPSNWFIETPSGRNQTPLAGKDVDRDDDTYSWGIVHALLGIGSSAGTSDGWIAPSWSHRDGGKPGREWFVYDAEKAAAAQKRWDEFQAIKTQWDTVEVPHSFDPTKLSVKALAIMRYLKKYRCHLLPFEELHDALKELRLQGLLKLLDDGCLLLTDAAFKARLPRGPVANLVKSPNRRQRKALAMQEGAFA